MTQIPTYFGPRYPAISRRSANALALWRSRDGLTTTVTDDTPITISCPLGALGGSMGKDALGNFVSSAEFLPRPYYWDLDGDGVLETPSLFTSPTISNVSFCPYSEDFTNWTAVNSGTILTPKIVMGETQLSLLSDTSGTLQRYWERTVVTGGDTRMCLSFFVAEGTITAAAGPSAVVWDNTASANRLVATWTWSTVNGVRTPAVTVSTGQLLSVEYCGRHAVPDPTTNRTLLKDVWRLTIRTNASYASANSNRIRLSPAQTANQQANQFFGGVALHQRSVYGYTKNAGATALYPTGFEWAMAFQGVPQAMTLAARIIYTGGPLCIPSGQTGTVVAVSNSGGALPRLAIFQGDGAGGTNYMAQIADGVNPALNVTHTASLNPNDDVLLRLALNDDGSMDFGISANGGTEFIVQSGNPYGLPAAWVASSAVRLTESGQGGEHYLGIGVFAGAPSANYIRAVMA